ncbi:YlxR family protein [Arcanobacterium haemolyticum]|nr:YlxR family protein [Arcanobacterium haemolyticum]
MGTTLATNPRTCVGCRRRDARTELVRIAVKDSALVPDLRAVLPGRGAWIHPDQVCLYKAIRSRAIQRALGVNAEESSVRLMLEQLVSDNRIT